MPSQLTVGDPALIEQAQRGDERAFATLYHRHVRYVTRVLHAVLREDKAEVEDLLQQTFTDAYVSLGQLKDPCSFRYWLTRIAARCAYDRLASRRKGQGAMQALARIAPTWSDPRAREGVHSLYQVLDGFSRELGFPWWLHVVHGETVNEVARRCDFSVSTAKRRIAEAQALINQRLDT